jgi:penicillin amidase
MPGAPGVVLGYNDRIAWGATNLGPDVQDLYLEKFDSANPKRYQTPTGWRDAEVRTEEIKVRKALIGTATETVSFDVTVTRHGPIFYEADGTKYSLRWPALEPDTGEVDALYQLTRARNWNEFTAGLSKYGGPTQNFVYADVDGNIGYYGAGRIPIRRSGDGSVPLDGSTDSGEWTGYIPFAELPHVYNPPDGVIVTANQRVAGTSYGHFLTHEWAQPFRARRVTDLLQAKPKLTADDFRDIQRDVYSIFVADFVREMIKLSDAHPESAGDQDWKDTITLFRAWDGRLTAEANAPPLASLTISAFTRKILTAAIGAERAKVFNWGTQNMLMRRLVAEQPKDWLPTEYSDYLALLRDCVKEARAGLARQVGPDPAQWTWGAVRVADFPHPIGRIPLLGAPFKIPGFPMNGGSSTINVGSYVSMRFVADLSDWDNTRHGVPLGESGLPSSKHWSDQLEQWRSGNTAVFPFSKTAVERASVEMLTLTPKAP